MNDEDSDDDGSILEESEVERDTSEGEARQEEEFQVVYFTKMQLPIFYQCFRSELDSDDLSEPENGKVVGIGPFTVQNLGPDAPLISSGGANDLQGDTGTTDVSTIAVTSPVMEMGSNTGEGEDSVPSRAGESTKKKPKKKKSVVFAENLEKATLIDKNAPVSFLPFFL